MTDAEVKRTAGRARRRQPGHRHDDDRARAGQRLEGHADLAAPRHHGRHPRRLPAQQAELAVRAAPTSTPKTAGKTDAEARAAGANLLVKTITNLTGLTINHYVQVDLLGFYRISQGRRRHPGQPVRRTSTTASDQPRDRRGRRLGPLHDQGQAHARTPSRRWNSCGSGTTSPHGDLDRVKRQQYFLTAAFRQVATTGILTKLNAVGDALQSSLYFDDGLNLHRPGQPAGEPDREQHRGQDDPDVQRLQRQHHRRPGEGAGVRGTSSSPARRRPRRRPRPRRRVVGPSRRARGPGRPHVPGAVAPIDAKCIY